MRQVSLRDLVQELGVETGRPSNVAFGEMDQRPVSEVYTELTTLVGSPSSVAFGAMRTARLDTLIRELSYEVGQPTNVAFGDMELVTLGELVSRARMEAGEQGDPSLAQSQGEAVIATANRVQQTLLAAYQFPGQPEHVEMRNQRDQCVIDANVLALNMAAEMLSRRRSEDAQIKLQRAERLTQAWVQAETMRQMLNRTQRLLYQRQRWPGVAAEPPAMAVASDTCVLDADALVLSAAAEILARSEAADAQAKAQDAAGAVRVWTQQQSMLDALNRMQRTLTARYDFPLIAGPGAVTTLVAADDLTTLDADTLIMNTAVDYLDRAGQPVPDSLRAQADQLVAIWTQQEEFRQVLNRVQRYLDECHDWPGQIATRETTIPAGTRFVEFPPDLPPLRIDRVFVYWLSAWHQLDKEIDPTLFTAFDSTRGEVADPVWRWRQVQSVASGSGVITADMEIDAGQTISFATGALVTMMEVWPIPQTEQEILIEGRRLIPDMRYASDVCLLDADVLVMKAAGEILERAGAADAPIKARRAEKLRQAVRGRHNQPKRQRYAGQVYGDHHRPLRSGIDWIKG